jgi:hypothetical protein
MKRFLLLITFCVYLVNGFSQVADPEKKLRDQRTDTINGWQTGGVLMINFGQASLTNWSAGGENSVSGNSILNYFANYKKGTYTWDNSFDFGYGMLTQGSQTRKTDDKIEITTKLGKAASKSWYYSGLLNFKSQFMPGYNYPNDSVIISKFFAPAYLVGAIGMDYKPRKELTVFIAPITGRITIVNDKTLSDAGAFGVTPGNKSRTEFGGYFRVVFQKDIMKNVNLLTKFDAFSNYVKKPQNIDINWEVLISMKVNKYISATLATNLIYDDDIIYNNKGPRTQFKEILGVGFSYKFPESKRK